MPPSVKSRRPSLFLDRVWEPISERCARPGKKVVVISYVGKGATKLLHFGIGDILVTNASDAAIRAGSTDANELHIITGKKTVIYNVDNLHAKVIITPRAVIIGSANASTNSKQQLLEACMSSTDSKVIASAGVWARSLFGDLLTPEQIERKMKLKVAARRFTGARKKADAETPDHAPLWLTYVAEFLEPGDLADEMTAGEEELDRTLDTNKYCAESRYWIESTDALYQNVQLDDQLIEIDHTYPTPRVHPPARVIRITRKTIKGEKLKLIYTELPLDQKSITLAAFRRKAEAIGLKAVAAFPDRLIKNPVIAHRLRQIW